MSENQAVRELVWSDDAKAMRQLIAAAQADLLRDDDLAELARALAASGAQLPRDSRAADLASTGGPSSLSTLLCPLHLRARGLVVPKLGVRGRPAGGVDVLETIPGFRSTLDQEASEAALRRSRYIHLLADEHWAPLDARLFAYRQREGAQNVPALVIGSILAKKVAAGVTGAGLEIRVAPHGNFGTDFDDAGRNARRYNRVATLLGLRPVCALTDGSRPYQPYIGRGEALLALAAVLDGEACDWLAEHHALCLRISDAVARSFGSDTLRPPERATMRLAHEEMLLAHGAEPSAFWDRADVIRTARRRTLSADRAGRIEYDLARLRGLLVDTQRSNGHPRHGAASDPAGVVLLTRPNAQVEAGEPVMAARACEGLEEFALRLQACIRVHPTDMLATDRDIEIVGP